jgi:hypothetical protein
MDDLLTLSRPEARPRRPDLVPAVLVGLALVVVLVVVGLSLRTPDTVSLTVQNPLSWRAEVEVRSAASANWTGVGAVGREGEVQFLQLPDQGSDWVIRYSYAGQSEEVAITRAQLEAGGWLVVVPAGLGERLEEAGVAPTTGGSAG